MTDTTVYVSETTRRRRMRQNLTTERKNLIKALAGWRCKRCNGHYPKDKRGHSELKLHHVERVSAGGENDWGNLEPICPDCHRLEHEQEMRSGWNAKEAPVDASPAGSIPVTPIEVDREDKRSTRMQFKRAERKRTFIKLAITGPSGSGKTYSALRLATGLGKRIALLDTENGSGELYADLCPYDAAQIAPPYTAEAFIEGIRGAVRAGYDVLIIDSISHAWAGDGGLLSQKEAMDARGGHKGANWAPITKLYEQFKAELLHSPIHLITTMRSKTEYIIEEGRGGAMKKVGLAPVMRDGIEYEFTVVFDIAADHTAIATKDRTNLFSSLTGRITEEHGERIARWLEGGAVAEVEVPQAVTQYQPQRETPATASNGNGSRNGSSSQAFLGNPRPGSAPPAMANGNGKSNDLASIRKEVTGFLTQIGQTEDDLRDVKPYFERVLGKDIPGKVSALTEADWREVHEALKEARNLQIALMKAWDTFAKANNLPPGDRDARMASIADVLEYDRLDSTAHLAPGEMKAAAAALLEKAAGEEGSAPAVDYFSTAPEHPRSALAQGV